MLSFRALPHRLQHVATIDGVAFYNDSKATNPASTMRALASFGPVNCSGCCLLVEEELKPSD